ncbi:MAG TPA: SRPBCC domain-containing protein, partial [Dongiaceae bacterium]|nr:SRPBCC domain-containing protein [Dongiaceae bacterium]
MPYQYTLTATIPASAREIYDAWLDSLAHSEMTGSRARVSSEVGAEFSAGDGYITGRNLELVPGKRIVQSWRTTEFADEHEDSTVTITFDEKGDGTLLTLTHSNVPD